jgi:hypothetical protein
LINASSAFVVLGALALGGCSFSASVGGSAVRAAEIEAKAQEQFAARLPVDSVECPEDLPAVEGATTTCTLVSGEQSFEMTVTATAVNGSDVDFDLNLADARTVDAADVAAFAEQEFAPQFSVESVECSEDLPAVEGATTTCTLVSGGRSIVMTATATAINGEDVEFDLDLIDTQAVAADVIQARAQEQFSEQFPVDSVECPDNLPGLEGATTTCTLTSGEQSFEMTVTATAVDGTDVEFDLNLADATSVAADEVEAFAQQQFSEQFPVDSVDCPDDLPAVVGATTICTLVSEGKPFEMTATVNTVEGSDVAFGLELTAEL